MLECAELASDTSETRCFIDASKSFLVSEPEKAIRLANSALEAAERSGNDEYIVMALKAVAFGHGYNYDPENSKPYYLRAVAILQELGDVRQQADMYLNLGADYEFVRQYDSTMFYFSRALPLYEESGDEIGIGRTQNNLAIVYRKLGYYSRAKEYYNLSLESKKRINNDEGVMNTYMNISALHYQMNDWDSTLFYALKAEKLATELGDIHTEGMIRLNLALAYAALDREEEAIVEFDRSRQIMEPLEDSRQLVRIYANAGLTYARAGKCDSAYAYVQRNEQYEAYHSLDIKKAISFTKALCATANGDFQTATTELFDFAAYQDTLYSEEQQRSVAELTYEYEQEVIRSNLLEKEKELLDSEAQKSRLFAVIAVVSGIALTLLLLIIYLKNSSKRRKERFHAQLQQQVSEMDFMQQKLAMLADAPLPEVAMSLEADQVNSLLVNPLTERELEILTKIASGRTNQQIADESFISVNTVKSHIHSIYNKLDVKNRTEATLKASSLNLIKS